MGVVVEAVIKEAIAFERALVAAVEVEFVGSSRRRGSSCNGTRSRKRGSSSSRGRNSGGRCGSNRDMEFPITELRLELETQ